MADRPLVKWFIRIFCALMALNILFTLVSACFVPAIDTIVYTCSGENACIVQLDFENRQIRYMKYNSDYSGRWLVGEMSGFMAVRLKYLAAFSKVPLWLGEYEGEDGEDVKSWAMDVYYGNRVRTVHGNGDMPVSAKYLIPEIEAFAEITPNIPEQAVPQNANSVTI